MTDNEVVKILTTDSFNDDPRRYYEALRLAVSGFMCYSKVKKIVDEFQDSQDVPFIERVYSETNKIEKAECFDKIVNIVAEDN